MSAESARRCQAPDCDRSLEGRRPQTRTCSEKCRQALRRLKVKSDRDVRPGAEELLQHRYHDEIAKARRAGELTPDQALDLLLNPSAKVLAMLADAEIAA